MKTLARWSIDDYHQMIEAGILQGRSVELLAGEIVEISPATPIHYTPWPWEMWRSLWQGCYPQPGSESWAGQGLRRWLSPPGRAVDQRLPWLYLVLKLTLVLASQFLAQGRIFPQKY